MNAKEEKLISLPEEIVFVLVDFLLEGLGIWQAKVDATSESLKVAPTELYLKLGPNDAIREQELNKRKTCHSQKSTLCRKAFGGHWTT
ncbi:hypothetical protein Y032_0016g3025 [Ancylostoma ceylanicum]|uniref:Uncharacterized protein n=1 Tax=Ancylostoma ceylanicum TaxID=53326 RepID=A0A016V881_9BILA|nr:hypothetical protein Y032_0016g3025 [Ancylostoma ceylanicum]